MRILRSIKLSHSVSACSKTSADSADSADRLWKVIFLTFFYDSGLLINYSVVAMQSESDGFATIGPPPLQPAISPSVHLSLTIVYITLYGCLFLFIYIQLWLVLYYKHKRFSYQTVFLGLCLLWAGLRTSLFSFYFKNFILANNLNTVFYWLLYCFPVCLQFITLCLLVLFFAQVRICHNLWMSNLAKRLAYWTILWPWLFKNLGISICNAQKVHIFFDLYMSVISSDYVSRLVIE